jgi:hypothetical protein
MAGRSIHITHEFLQRRWSAQFVPKKEWLFGPDPDPTYDRTKGWKLDQFAMFFVPDVVRTYKRVMAEGHPHAPPSDPLEFKHPWEWIERSNKLSDEIMQRLLADRFEVSGCPLDCYTPRIISHALLENMHPDIMTSELRDINGATDTARWFEKVRVFDLAPTAKSSGGRKPTYDWPRLAEQLEKEKPDLATMAELVAYCRKNVRVIQGKRAPKDGPDNKTITAAILKHGLGKFIKPA